MGRPLLHIQATDSELEFIKKLFRERKNHEKALETLGPELEGEAQSVIRARSDHRVALSKINSLESQIGRTTGKTLAQLANLKTCAELGAVKTEFYRSVRDKTYDPRDALIKHLRIKGGLLKGND